MNDQATEDLAMAARLRHMANTLTAEARTLEAKHKREQRKPKGVINALREAGMWDKRHGAIKRIKKEVAV